MESLERGRHHEATKAGLGRARVASSFPSLGEDWVAGSATPLHPFAELEHSAKS